jgi:tetratricopeptide (TPR) repeat protein
VALEEYLNHTFIEFTRDNLFNKKTHETKLRLLTFQVNSLFKNGKFEDSLQKTEVLYEAMKEYDGFLHDKFLFFYYNTLVINYSKTDELKAIEILLKAKDEQIIKESDYNYFFVYSNLSLLYFDRKQYKTAIKYLSRITLHQNFYDFAQSFQLKVVSAELIIRYEIKDFDHLEHRINQIKKEFKTILLQDEFKRELLLINIVEKLIITNNISQNKVFKKEIDTLLNSTTSRQAGETDVINYNKWLMSKI